MLVIPAIDIKEGKCVRLKQGQMDQAKVYFDNPVDCAQHWVRLGTKRLHVVDLDGAVIGKTQNSTIIKKIRQTFPNIQLQVGGGIRTKDTIQNYLDDMHIDFIVLGTYALKYPDEAKRLTKQYPNRIYISLDIAAGKAYVDGWLTTSNLTIQEVLDEFATSPLAGIVITDITKDGMLSGIDTPLITNITSQTHFSLIVAGGVRDINDIHKLHSMTGIQGVICGKSLYEKSLDFSSALQLIQEYRPSV